MTAVLDTLESHLDTTIYRVAKIADTSNPIDPFPAEIHAVAMYVGGDTPHVATDADWRKFPKYHKLPIFVRSGIVGASGGTADGWTMLHALYELGVPEGSAVMYDRETNTDAAATAAFGSVLHWAGYEVWPYGSTGNLFAHPALNGYWPADPTGVPHMYPHEGVIATQYEWGHPKGYDESEIRLWQLLHKTSARWAVSHP